MTRDEMIEAIAEAVCMSDCRTIEDLSLSDFEPRWASLRDTYLANSRDALSALEAAGYVVVPKEPGVEMLANGAAAARDFYSENGSYPRSRAVWAAMLSASQQEKTDG